MRILLLGGTTEARRLAEMLGGDSRFDATFSLAGRTSDPLASPLSTRIGGFGGVGGVIDYIKAERIERVVDATHPFAARITRNAAEACASIGVPIARLERPAWVETTSDRWTDVSDLREAALALSGEPRTVFLATGQSGLEHFRDAPQHRYVVRAIGQPAVLPTANTRVVLARGPFALEDELDLFRREGVDLVVAKNSGGEATVAKLHAARHLALPVIMVRRPALPAGLLTYRSETEIIAWLGSAQAERGV